MKFFQPEVHGLISNDLTTGKAATSEIPLLYYSIAILYKIFGYHDLIYRLVNTLIFLFGIYSLFRLLNKLKTDIFWSVSLSLLFFASPVLAYYGNNFITDITAFSLSLAGWNYFIGYCQNQQKKQYIYAMIFLFLGMSMKISAGISVITLLCIYFIDISGLLKFKPTGKLFPNKGFQLLPFILTLLIVGVWAFYARIYNTRNGCFYFSTYTFPLWEMSQTAISETFKNIRFLWLDQYFHRYTQILFLIIFIINLIHIKKANRLLITSNIIIFAGVVMYSILWFDTFKNHDYYTINLYILPVITMTAFAEYMNRLYPKLSGNYFTRGLLVFILVFNVIHTQKQMNYRYHDWWNEYPKFRDFDTITPYLRSIGISRFDKVISIPDQTHHTLYIMNQPGWTECYSLNRDSVSVQQSIDRGAKYLVAASEEDLISRPYLSSFTKDLAGKYGSVLIFKLRGPVKE